jgi:hypothetical protein
VSALARARGRVHGCRSATLGPAQVMGRSLNTLSFTCGARKQPSAAEGWVIGPTEICLSSTL